MCKSAARNGWLDVLIWLSLQITIRSTGCLWDWLDICKQGTQGADDGKALATLKWVLSSTLVTAWAREVPALLLLAAQAGKRGISQWICTYLLSFTPTDKALVASFMQYCQLPADWGKEVACWACYYGNITLLQMLQDSFGVPVMIVPYLIAVIRGGPNNWKGVVEWVCKPLAAANLVWSISMLLDRGDLFAGTAHTASPALNGLVGAVQIFIMGDKTGAKRCINRCKHEGSHFCRNLWRMAVRYGKTDLFDRMMELECPGNWTDVCMDAADERSNTSLPFLQWLRSTIDSQAWDELMQNGLAIQRAGAAGSLQTVQWLWSVQERSTLSNIGAYMFINWILVYRLPTTPLAASLFGEAQVVCWPVRIIEWAFAEAGATWEGWACEWRDEAMKSAVANGVDMVYAERAQQLFNWAHENGCPCTCPLVPDEAGDQQQQQQQQPVA